MTMISIHQTYLRLTLRILFSACFFISPLSAWSSNTHSSTHSSTQWLHHTGVKLRLIGLLQGDQIKAGLQINMEQGWKTYWHSPGTGGIPPQVQFTTSSNLSPPRLLLPTPQSFPLDETIGYKESVVFLIESRLTNPNKPATLNAEGLLGLCSKICVPVPFQFSLPLSPTSTPTPIQDQDQTISSILTTATARLPLKPQSTQKIIKTSLSPTSTHLFVEAHIPKDSKRLSLFAQGPPEWLLRAARLTHRQGTKAHFTFGPLPESIDALGTDLHYILVADEQSIEQSVKLGH